MAKLTHIEDLERQAEARRAQAEAQQTAYEEQVERIEEIPLDEDLTSREEEEFHGLDSSQPMGAGHKALIILALAVVAIAILYIVNSYVHFF